MSSQLFELLVLGSIAFWQIIALAQAYRTGKVRTGNYLSGEITLRSENPQRFQWELVARVLYIAITIAIAAAQFWIGNGGQS
jgi:hypothetical protein